MGEILTRPLPIIGGINQGPDDVGLDNFGADTRDCYIDTNGSLARRDGLVKFCDFLTGAKVDGLFWVDDWAEMIGVSGGNIFKITDSLGSFSNTTSDPLTAGIRPTFAYDGSLLIMANSGRMVTLANGGSSTFMADPDAPTTVTHVGFLDKMILANDVGTDDFYFSQINASLDWDNNWFSAEAVPDLVTSMLIHNREILLSGPKSHEVWFNDLASPFSRKDTAFVQQGVIAPYSVINVNGIWYALNEHREIVAIAGRLPVPVHPGINEVIQGFTTVNDCFTDVIKAHGTTLILFSFPSEGRTLVLDQQTGLFFEWSYWNLRQAQYERFKGNCVAYSPLWNKILIGDRATGKVYTLDPNAYTDDGDIIRAMRQTGHISHGTMKSKTCHGLKIRLKRTAPGLSNPTNLLVDFQDNGNGVWSNAYTVPLSAESRSGLIGYLPGPLGAYETRMWRFYTTSTDVPFVLSQVHEDFEITDY